MPLVINTDSHHVDGLVNRRFGAAVARRAWCSPVACVELLPPARFFGLVAHPQSGKVREVRRHVGIGRPGVNSMPSAVDHLPYPVTLAEESDTEAREITRQKYWQICERGPGLQNPGTLHCCGRWVNGTRLTNARAKRDWRYVIGGRGAGLADACGTTLL